MALGNGVAMSVVRLTSRIGGRGRVPRTAVGVLLVHLPGGARLVVAPQAGQADRPVPAAQQAALQAGEGTWGRAGRVAADDGVELLEPGVALGLSARA